MLTFRSFNQTIKQQVFITSDEEMTASQAYYEFLRNLKQECENGLELHVKNANRLICPRRRNFNVLYSKYFDETFGERYQISMFEKLEENIKLL